MCLRHLFACLQGGRQYLVSLLQLSSKNTRLWFFFPNTDDWKTIFGCLGEGGYIKQRFYSVLQCKAVVWWVQYKMSPLGTRDSTFASLAWCIRALWLSYSFPCARFLFPTHPLFFKNVQQDHSGEVNEWCWADGDVASEASVQLSFSSNEICPDVKIFVSKAPLWLILSYMWQTCIFVQRYKTVLTQTLFEIFCLNI